MVDIMSEMQCEVLEHVDESNIVSPTDGNYFKFDETAVGQGRAIAELTLFIRTRGPNTTIS